MTAAEKTEWMRAAQEAQVLLAKGDVVSMQLVARLMVESIPIVDASTPVP